MTDTLTPAIDQIIADSTKLHEVVHGSDDAVVSTEGGDIRTLAKAIKEVDFADRRIKMPALGSPGGFLQVLPNLYSGTLLAGGAWLPLVKVYSTVFHPTYLKLQLQTVWDWGGAYHYYEGVLRVSGNAITQTDLVAASQFDFRLVLTSTADVYQFEVRYSNTDSTFTGILTYGTFGVEVDPPTQTRRVYAIL
jgi:hypothetical protein